MTIDLLYVLILLIAVYKGIRKGLIVAVLSFIGLLIGIATAVSLSGLVAGKLSTTYTTLGLWTPAIAFLLVFFATVLAIRLIAKMIEAGISLASLGWMNNLAGGVLYAAMATLSFSVFLFFGEQLHLVGKQSTDSSITYSFIAPWGPKTIEGLSVIFPPLKEMFFQMQAFFKQLSEKSVQ